MAVTGNRQMEYGGLLIGTGTVYGIRTVTGLGPPETRSSDRTIARRHGLHPGDDFLAGRTINIAINVVDTDDGSRATKMAALRAAFVPAGVEAPLIFQMPDVAGGGRRMVMCRPRPPRGSFNIDRELTAGVARDVIQLVATDPRIYGADTHEIQVGLPTAGAGLSWPLTWPLNWGAVGETGIISVTNAGNFTTGAILRCDGPVTNPRFENITASKTIEVDLVVADGDYLLLDTLARTVLLNGTASRYSSLTSNSQWWDLAPGVNELRFRASTETSALLTVSHRDAYYA